MNQVQILLATASSLRLYSKENFERMAQGVVLKFENDVRHLRGMKWTVGETDDQEWFDAGEWSSLSASTRMTVVEVCSDIQFESALTNLLDIFPCNLALKQKMAERRLLVLSKEVPCN